MIASTKKTVAVAFESAWMLAVRFNGVPLEITSQSRKPVSTVTSEKQAATIRASHHAWAKPWSATPTLLRIAATVAKVYEPIVASVSGGWLGCPGKPRSGFMPPAFPRDDSYNTK